MMCVCRYDRRHRQYHHPVCVIITITITDNDNSNGNVNAIMCVSGAYVMAAVMAIGVG